MTTDDPSLTEQEAQSLPKTEQEIVDYKDKYFRLLAEMENLRKRLQKEKQEAVRFGIENVLVDILNPLDHLENALTFADQMSDEIRNWAMGFQMILSQFKEILTQNGVSSFVSEGQLFDSSKHEVIEVEESDSIPEGIIIKEFLKGYRCGEHTIRPARVKIAKKLTIKEEGDINHGHTTEEK